MIVFNIINISCAALAIILTLIVFYKSHNDPKTSAEAHKELSTIKKILFISEINFVIVLINILIKIIFFN